jgi:hypothetical protein
MTVGKPSKPLWLTPDGLQPPPLTKLAMHGLAGEVIRTVGPHSEASTPALLMTFLVSFGSAAGHEPGFNVGRTRHGTNLNCVIAGATSSGRKGTSFNDGASVIEMADIDWAEGCVRPGLSTGEGLIHHVRDRTVKPGKEGVLETDDPGVDDKRLLVLETEFSTVLTRMAGSQNTLSQVVRDAWDRKRKLGTLTKHSSETATNPHISIIGHITIDELRALFTSADMANGFGNRFLWVYTERSKLLPEPTGPSDNELAPYAERVHKALDFAKKAGDLERDEPTRKLWNDRVYAALEADRHGLLGKLTGRASPQVARLSAVYALLDRSPVVRVEHLKAALAVWRYCEASTAHVFRDTLGDPTAQRILELLRDAGDKGLSRSQINDRFGRHGHAKIKAALKLLHERGLARTDHKKTGGRPSEWWWAV